MGHATPAKNHHGRAKTMRCDNDHHQHGWDEDHHRLADAFPDNVFVRSLVRYAERLNVTFRKSPVPHQWLYHHEHRCIYVWEPDLKKQSLSFLVVVLAHELGHVIDFDLHPEHRAMAHHIHFTHVPAFVEICAFVYAYDILCVLSIPFTVDQYEQMIIPHIAPLVRREIESRHAHHLACSLAAAG